VLIRSSLLKKIGPYNETLAFYFEDADFCYRVKEAGFKVWYQADALMWHKTSTTLAKNRSAQLRYSIRNNLYFLRRHRIGGAGHGLTLAVFLGVICPALMARFAVCGQMDNAMGIWRGILDWWNDRYGMYQ
jgi:GT2 family glycosyltransferase